MVSVADADADASDDVAFAGGIMAGDGSVARERRDGRTRCRGEPGVGLVRRAKAFHTAARTCHRGITEGQKVCMCTGVRLRTSHANVFSRCAYSRDGSASVSLLCPVNMPSAEKRVHV